MDGNENNSFLCLLLRFKFVIIIVADIISLNEDENQNVYHFREDSKISFKIFDATLSAQKISLRGFAIQSDILDY